MTTDRITPSDLRELAEAAEDLARRLNLAQTSLAGEDDGPRRRVRYPLAGLATQTRRAAITLQGAADELARIAAVPEHACGTEWGVCPEHGGTLRAGGGRCWCTTPGCGRQWGYDRASTPCHEPVTHQVTEADGRIQHVCDGHAVSARRRLEATTVVPFT